MADVRLNMEGKNRITKGQGQVPHGVNQPGMSPSAVHGSEEMRSRGRKNDKTRGGATAGTGKKATHKRSRAH